MQNTPVVRLPEKKRHNTLALFIATLAIIAIVVLVVVTPTRPVVVTTEPAVTIYTNPEVSQAARYLAWREASESAYANPEAARAARYTDQRQASEAVAGPTNPELSSANYYQQIIARDRFLRENPEIRRFLQLQE